MSWYTIPADSLSRKRPLVRPGFFSTELVWASFCLIVSRVDFVTFVLFREAVGVYCCVAVEIQLEALCFVRSPRATGALHATNPRPSGLVALNLAESRQSYGRGSRWQNGVDTARCCLRTMHADLRRKAAAVVAAKPASARLYATAAVWYLVWVRGRVGVYLWRVEQCDGFKNTLSTDFFGWICQPNCLPSRARYFSTVTKPDLGLSQEGPLSTDKSDRIRIGLRTRYFWRIVGFGERQGARCQLNPWAVGGMIYRKHYRYIPVVMTLYVGLSSSISVRIVLDVWGACSPFFSVSTNTTSILQQGSPTKAVSRYMAVSRYKAVSRYMAVSRYTVWRCPDIRRYPDIWRYSDIWRPKPVVMTLYGGMSSSIRARIVLGLGVPAILLFY